MMATKIYGASDDLIEFAGDVTGEVGHFGTDNNEHGDLIICSDGTLLEALPMFPPSISLK